jgi:hypothetical protein
VRSQYALLLVDLVGVVIDEQSFDEVERDLELAVDADYLDEVG